ncbi:hypothetical protein J3R30DRAFT_3685772 [Lentinula aciculospora]|uniref:Uncharacterized protein n=1 Tax=Lentinula aciculospora TaxID=153920 RepID=A0A9W9A0M2_9AGAR|nr:hypothetical protein J3R30DRAFT_3685772 [Lentinula aciculospora]
MSSTGQHYVVYMPYDPTADAYPVYVQENAFVRDLEAAIRSDFAFKHEVEGHHLLLFKLRENAKAARMRPASFLSEYFPDGPAPQKDRKIDVIAVTGTMFAELHPSLPSELTPLHSLHDVSSFTKSTVPAKRPRTYDRESLAESDYLCSLWREWWDIPLSAEFTGTRTDGRPFDSYSETDGPLKVEDGDVLPGLPFMEHYGPERKLLYVRAEYLRMYEYINYCIGLRRDGITASSPAVIITGQPGVGKTVGSSYFLRRRLGEKKPTMLLQGGIYHLFHDMGVDRVAKGSSVFTNKFEGFSEPPWCLIDSADAPDGIPRSVVGIGLSGVNPIYISSPNNSRWSKLHQSRTKYVAIMNPWTEKELVVA